MALVATSDARLTVHRPNSVLLGLAGDLGDLQKFWPDQGFTGRMVDWTAQILGRDRDIVRKDPGPRGFQVQPKRWAIERTFSWLTAHCRLARAYETSAARSEAVIRWARIGMMVRRLTRPQS